jgi:hypothetical protein
MSTQVDLAYAACRPNHSLHNTTFREPVACRFRNDKDFIDSVQRGDMVVRMSQ